MQKSIFCNQCGYELPSGSRFCTGCGAALVSGPAAGLGPSDQSIPQRRSAAWTESGTARAPMPLEDERVVFTLRPTMIFVYCWYALAGAVLIAAAAVTGLLNNSAVIDGRSSLLIITGVGLAAFTIPLYKHILRRREVYTLTNFKLEMRYGLIAKDVRNIPLNKIQDVTVTSSVWQRLVKLGDIVIDSASETGKIHLDDIHNPEGYADLILAELRRS